MASFNIRFMTTDNWGSYAREIEAEKHLAINIFTQCIGRHGLTLCIFIKRLSRKIICYLRSIEIHEKLISIYIYTNLT
ncbi:IS1 family transposase [Xenorhabdus sp. KK7.4]|uniref:IS1 family transposase n=1 Tax=Xenorhabdus sp. KK7.4 TaxID=1851572 RepID=UPI00352E55C8